MGGGGASSLCVQGVQEECLKPTETEASYRGPMCGLEWRTQPWWCRHCSSRIQCLLAGLAEAGLLLAWKDLHPPAISRVAHDAEGLASWSSHPTQFLCWSTLISFAGNCQEAGLPSSSLTLSAAHGKFIGLGARAWREVVRGGPLLPQAMAGVPLVLGPGFSQDPCLLVTRGILMQNPHPVWFPLHQNGAPCLVNFYFVAYLEAVKKDPGGPSAVIVSCLIIFPEPDY